MRDYQLEACRIIEVALKAAAPYDTGNLALNSIRIQSDHSAVLIGGEDVAPYAVYTNEPWLSEKWGGKVNPNEGWVQNTLQNAAPVIQKTLSGSLTQEEYNELLAKYNDEIERRQKQRIAALEKLREKI